MDSQKPIKFLKISILFTVFTLFSGLLIAQPDGYYDDADGLTGEELKTELHEIINDHNEQSYSSLWTHLEDTDAKSDGTVWDMYSDNPDGDTPYEFTFGDHQCGTYQEEGDCYNREHSFPKSWFGDVSPMNTDMFHIYPTDGYVNGKRANLPFGETESPDWISENGSKKGSCSYSGYSGTIFEPIDEYKGDFARTYFYMVTRYEDKVDGWENNGDGADAMLDGTTFPAFKEWAIDILVEWHNEDPVSQKEIDRNDAVYDVQNNRNPFIDNPEYVNNIWGEPSEENIPPEINNIETDPSSPDSSDEVNIAGSITDEDGTITSAEVNWGLTSDNLDNTISMTDNGSSYVTESAIPEQEGETTVYYQVSATDDSSETTTSSVFDYTVDMQKDTVLSEDFSACPPENWTIKSVAGSEEWTCTDGYININAYGSDEACDDWLITPSFNPNDFNDEILSFETWTDFADDYYPPLKVKYSTDYTAGDDPSSATWTDLSSTLAEEDSETWTNSEDVSLSDIEGDKIHIAFQYTSSGTGAGSSSEWRVDNVTITGSENAEQNTPPDISNIDAEPSDPEPTDEVNIKASITDEDGTINSAEVNWGLSSDNLSNTISMTDNGDHYISEGAIPEQEDETTVYYKVSATDNSSETTTSSTLDYTVEEYAPEYCDSKGEDASYEWIDDVQVGDFTNDSGEDNGYGDYTNQTAELATGESHEITLTPGFSGSTYQEYWKIWIDFNGDEEFDDSELVYDAGSASSSEETGSIDIPSDASGSTRMRVSMKYNGEPSACESFSYGEVEDYTVKLSDDGGGNDDDTEAPTAPANLASSNITETSVDLTWDASSDNVDVEKYTVYQDGESIGTTENTSYSVSDLTEGTTYTFTVKAEDATGNVSGPSNEVEITTEKEEDEVIEYCESKGENTNYEWIEQVELGSISNNSGSDGGYADYTNLSADLSPGSEATIYFSAGFASSSYTEYWHVWIDFNQNGEFESDEEVVTGSSSNSDKLEKSFNVPAEADPGETRMRVTMKYNDEASPCESFSYGEVEDYTVNITDDASNNNFKNSKNAIELGNATEGLKLHPNPATNHLNVKINEGERNSSIGIYDTHGKLVKTVSVNGDFKEIDISDLPGGVYILKVNDERAPLVEEFIKK
ncbi:MAG: endonuclease [Bacteroidota bacterium]